MPFQDRTDGSVFYVSRTATRFTTFLFKQSQPEPSKRPRDPIKTELLWGDRVRLLRNPDGSFKTENGRHRARARGQYGWVAKSHLGSKQLLELYFIDVGQGDGVLIRTPRSKHILIDGGWPRRSQPTGKNAADFVDWKFVKDYESKAIDLDVVICSHNDQDHYGGLWDLVDSAQDDELDAQSVFVEQFNHAGLSWWKRGRDRTLSAPVSTSQGEMYTQLIEDRQSVVDGLKTTASPKLQGEWAQFLEKMTGAKTRSGAATPFERLSHATGTLVGFDGSGGSVAGVPEPTIHVLGPVEFEVDGKPAIRRFKGGDSKNTNGNSVLLRLDCGDVRILLTGDLNTASQDSLLGDYRGDEDAFECDVAKACHHGSGDVSFAFLKAMEPSVTVFSSGDSEGHDHPKPSILAASGAAGNVTFDDEVLVTPLIYITELARSVELGKISEIHRLAEVGNGATAVALDRLRATTKVTKAGDRDPETVKRRVEGSRLATKTVYGLINVRTDGRTILCAALNEKDATFNVEVVKPKERTP
jgi:beta-lactamase superfamily II metal-dependent hydrolase